MQQAHLTKQVYSILRSIIVEQLDYLQVESECIAFVVTIDRWMSWFSQDEDVCAVEW